MQNLNTEISIVFPSYNGAQFLNKNLDSIKKLKNKNNIELVVVDNFSEDSTVDVLKSYESEINIKLLRNNFNKGYAEACNFGVKNASGEFVFITNQDVIFPPDFFEKLIKLYTQFKKDQEIVISHALVFETGRIHYFGAKNHFLGFSYTPEVGEKLPKQKIIKRTQRFSGGTLFIKKDFFLKLGGFDIEFFMYYEDTDLSYRLLKNGNVIYTTNDPFLIHQKRCQSLNDFQYYFLERNRFVLLIKNIEELQKLIPFMIIVEFVLLIHSIFIKKFKLRVKIYLELILNIKHFQFSRERLKKQGSLLSYRKLSKTLDPNLLGGMQKLKSVRRMLKGLNFLLKFI